MRELITKAENKLRYIKIRTQRISLLLKKRFTTPNWIKHKEPREFHMFVDLFLQELGAIGREVKQILPQGLRGHLLNNSNESTASVQYPKGQEPTFGNPSSKVVQAKS